MPTLEGKAGRFLALHQADRPLVQPNAWDVGSAKMLASLGFEAIATTSSGFAATLGRLDGSVTATRRWRTERSSLPRSTCRSQPTPRTASPMIPPGSRRW